MQLVVILESSLYLNNNNNNNNSWTYVLSMFSFDFCLLTLTKRLVYRGMQMDKILGREWVLRPICGGNGSHIKRNLRGIIYHKNLITRVKTDTANNEERRERTKYSGEGWKTGSNKKVDMRQKTKHRKPWCVLYAHGEIIIISLLRRELRTPCNKNHQGVGIPWRHETRSFHPGWPQSG